MTVKVNVSDGTVKCPQCESVLLTGDLYCTYRGSIVMCCICDDIVVAYGEVFPISKYPSNVEVYDKFAQDIVDNYSTAVEYLKRRGLYAGE